MARAGRSRSTAGERPAHVDPVGLRLIAEALVDPPHGDVPRLVLGEEGAQAGMLRPGDLGALERARNAAAAPGAAEAGQRMPGDAGCRRHAEPGVAHDLVAVEGDEGRLGQEAGTVEVLAAPFLVRARLA